MLLHDCNVMAPVPSSVLVYAAHFEPYAARTRVTRVRAYYARTRQKSRHRANGLLPAGRAKFGRFSVGAGSPT